MSADLRLTDKQLEPRQRASGPTLKEIAELAGVSPATVSRVVNGSPDVSRTIRSAVEAVLAERGYVRRNRRRMANTRLVGITMPYTAPAYFATILQGAVEALLDHDMRAVVFPTRHEHSREASLLEQLSHGGADGALLVLPEESNEELEALAVMGFPFVVVDPLQQPTSGIAAVSAANASAGAQATNHLIALGHRRIAAITGPRKGVATTGRLRGYHAALVAAGLSPDPSLEIESDFLLDGGKRAALGVLQRPNPPTAIFAFNDSMAIGVLHAARELGIKVPEQLSVVGVDDVPEARAVIPQLTTVRQPLAEMGRMAVNLLLRLRDGQNLEPLHVELETRLEVRSSTAPPPA